MNFQDDFTSFPFDNFKGHFVLVFDLNPIHDAFEICPDPEIVGEPLKLELNFNLSAEHFYELIFLRATNVLDCFQQIWCC